MLQIYGNEDDPLKKRTRKNKGSKDQYDPAFDRLQMYLPQNMKGLPSNFKPVQSSPRRNKLSIDSKAGKPQ